MTGRFRSVLFLWCFKVRCFVIILFKCASQIFLISLILVTCKNKATFTSLLRQKIYSPSRFPSLFLSSLESFSAKLGEHYIVICINPAFFKMIDGTEKPKIPSKFVLRAARYNEFRCNFTAKLKTRWSTIYSIFDFTQLEICLFHALHSVTMWLYFVEVYVLKYNTN